MAGFGSGSSEPGGTEQPQQPQQYQQPQQPPSWQQPEQPSQGTPQGYTAPPQGYTPTQGGPGNMPMQPQQPMQQPMQPVQGPPQGYSAPPQGMGAATSPPQRKRSPLFWIGIAVVALILVCVIGVFSFVGVIFGATQPVVDASDAYMTALRDGDYSRAFDLSTTFLKQDVTDAGGLEARLSRFQPASWSFTSRNINNNDGAVSGTTKYKDGSTGTVDIKLTKVGNDWLVDGINLK